MSERLKKEIIVAAISATIISVFGDNLVMVGVAGILMLGGAQ